MGMGMGVGVGMGMRLGAWSSQRRWWWGKWSIETGRESSRHSKVSPTAHRGTTSTFSPPVIPLLLLSRELVPITSLPLPSPWRTSISTSP